MEQTVLLRMTDITKTFPGVKALDHVSLEVKAGTVHALMGENGAGKSTLMKCLFGIYSKDSGHIYLEGREVNFTSSKEALNNGVAMVHQELNQALKRTVMDNLWLGRYPKIAGFIVDEHKMLRDTKAIFEELGIDVDPHRVMGTMPVSQRQMVEIAKAVSYHSKVIVFDEPTSSLTEEEVEHLFRIINMLRDRGMGIIYISHKMAEIKRISDEITVMRDGQLVATRPASELEMNDIIRLMVGRELGNQFGNVVFHQKVILLLSTSCGWGARAGGGCSGSGNVPDTPFRPRCLRGVPKWTHTPIFCIIIHHFAREKIASLLKNVKSENFFCAGCWCVWHCISPLFRVKFKIRIYSGKNVFWAVFQGGKNEKR